MSFKKRERDEDEEQLDTGDSGDFESMLNESLKQPEKKLRIGEKIKAEVLSVGKENVIVATGTRHDGFVPTNLLRDKDGKPRVKSGEFIDLFVTYIKGS